MKTIMFLLRYLCLMALILVIVYAPDALLYSSSGAAEQLPGCETVARVWSQWLHGTWYRETWFHITAGILLILSFSRGVTAIWNTLYALSLILMLAAGSLFIINLPLALPSAIGSMPELQFLPTLYRTEAALVSFIPVVFLLGLLLSNARLRILLYSIICYALWYGLSELFTYLLSLWQQAETPFMPELLAFLYDTRWLLVALIGAFLLVYDLILAFTETFAKPAAQPAAPAKDTSPESKGPSQPTAPAAASAPARREAPATTAPKLSPAPLKKHETTPAPPSKPTAGATPAAGVTTPKPAPRPVLKPAAAPAPAQPAAPTAPAPATSTAQQSAEPGAPADPAAKDTAGLSAHRPALASSTPPTPEPAATAGAIAPNPPPAPMPPAKPFAPSQELRNDEQTEKGALAAPTTEEKSTEAPMSKPDQTDSPPAKTPAREEEAPAGAQPATPPPPAAG